MPCYYGIVCPGLPLLPTLRPLQPPPPPTELGTNTMRRQHHDLLPSPSPRQRYKCRQTQMAGSSTTSQPLAASCRPPSSLVASMPPLRQWLIGRPPSPLSCLMRGAGTAVAGPDTTLRSRSPVPQTRRAASVAIGSFNSSIWGDTVTTADLPCLTAKARQSSCFSNVTYNLSRWTLSRAGPRECCRPPQALSYLAPGSSLLLYCLLGRAGAVAGVLV